MGAQVGLLSKYTSYEQECCVFCMKRNAVREKKAYVLLLEKFVLGLGELIMLP